MSDKSASDEKRFASVFVREVGDALEIKIPEGAELRPSSVLAADLAMRLLAAKVVFWIRKDLRDDER